MRFSILIDRFHFSSNINRFTVGYNKQTITNFSQKRKIIFFLPQNLHSLNILLLLKWACVEKHLVWYCQAQFIYHLNSFVCVCVLVDFFVWFVFSKIDSIRIYCIDTSTRKSRYFASSFVATTTTTIDQ